MLLTVVLYSLNFPLYQRPSVVCPLSSAPGQLLSVRPYQAPIYLNGNDNKAFQICIQLGSKWLKQCGSNNTNNTDCITMCCLHHICQFFFFFFNLVEQIGRCLQQNLIDLVMD